MMSAPAVIGNAVKLVPVTIFSATAPWNEAKRSEFGMGSPPPTILTIGAKKAAAANSAPAMIAVSPVRPPSATPAALSM